MTRQAQTRTEQRTCAACGGEFADEVAVFSILGRERLLRHRECPGCRVAREEEERRQAQEARISRIRQAHARFRSGSGMPRALWKKSLENWIGRGRVFSAVRRYAEGFPLGDAFDYPSLFLHSRANGLGKTHLAAGAANCIFDRWLESALDGEIEVEGRVRCPVLYHTGPDLLLRVRATYDVRPEEAAWRESEAELWWQLLRVPLLILDDVGKEAERRASEHTQRVYFQLIDGRYLKGLPVLICSNMGLEELESFLGPKVGPAVADRLVEMTRGRVLELRGGSYRRKLFSRGDGG